MIFSEGNNRLSEFHLQVLLQCLCIFFFFVNGERFGRKNNVIETRQNSFSFWAHLGYQCTFTDCYICGMSSYKLKNTLLSKCAMSEQVKVFNQYKSMVNMLKCLCREVLEVYLEMSSMGGGG